MKNTVRQKGITLIALIITIIVLLILAGITIGALTSNNSILNQAGNAKKETVESEEAEKVNLAVMDAVTNASKTVSGELTTEFVKNAIKGQFGNGSEENVSGDGPWKYKGEYKTYQIDKTGRIREREAKSEKTKRALLSSGGIYLLTDKGNLYCSHYEGDFPEEGHFGIFDDQDKILVAENVKDFNTYYYITNNNEMYYISDGSKIADNVKIAYGYSHYITMDNKFYYISDHRYAAELVKENIKEYYTDSITSYYLTPNNELYQFSNDNKIAENVKNFDRSCYLTNNNELYSISTGSKIAENVKSHSDGFYLNMNGEMYCVNPMDENEFVKCAEGIKELRDHSYLTNNNELYLLNNTKIDEDVLDYEANKYTWYEKMDGTVYVLHPMSV